MNGERHHGVSPYEAAYGFARGVRVGNVVHIAGTAPVPEPGEELEPTAAGQMRRCAQIAEQALTALGASMDDVVRTRMFIVNPDDADAIGSAHKEVFGSAEPAATMVVVASLLDPDWVVEIEVEAIVSDGVEV